MHKGFSFVDVFSPCVTYNKDNTYQFFNPRVKILEEAGPRPVEFRQGHGTRLSMGRGNPHRPVLETHRFAVAGRTGTRARQGGPLAFRELGISDEQAQALIG